MERLFVERKFAPSLARKDRKSELITEEDVLFPLFSPFTLSILTSPSPSPLSYNSLPSGQRRVIMRIVKREKTLKYL